MPFNYNPGVTSTVGQTWQRSNEALGQALISLFTQMGAAKERKAEQAKQEAQGGKAALAYFDSLGEEGQKQTGISKQELSNMSAADATAWMTGNLKSLGAREFMQSMAERDRQRKQQEEIGKALQSVLAGAGTDGGATNANMDPLMPTPVVTNNPSRASLMAMPATAATAAQPQPAKVLSVESLLAGVRRNPMAAQSPAFLNLISQIQGQQGRQATAEETAKNRMDIAQLVEGGKNARQASREAATADWREQERQGKSLTAILNNKRAVLDTLLAYPGTAGSNREEQQQTFSDLRGQIREIEDEMTGRGKGAAKGTTAGKAEAAPADPTKRMKGTVYQTPKGLYEWTGSGWQPAKQ